MSTLIVIPARLGSTRLPNKPLCDLAGRPLIVRVLEQVLRLGIDANVVVAVDDVRVADVVRAAGGTAVMTRSGHVSGTDRVAEVARLGEYAGHDLIVNVQGDEPFITAAAVEAAVEPVRCGLAPIGTVAVHDEPSILALASVVKVVRDAAGRAMYFSRAPIPFLRDPVAARTRDDQVLRHIGVYAYRPEALHQWVALPPGALERVEQLEQLRPLAAGIPIGVGICDSAPPAGIDTEDDLRRANAQWQSARVGAHHPSSAGIN